jgi:hypothetical protein
MSLSLRPVPLKSRESPQTLSFHTISASSTGVIDRKHSTYIQYLLIELLEEYETFPKKDVR